MVQWLAHWTSDLKVMISGSMTSPCHRVVPLGKKLYPTLSLSTQAPVVQKLDSAIHRINLYPVDNTIGFPNTYPLDSDLSGGWRHPTFEQLGPGV